MDQQAQLKFKLNKWFVAVLFAFLFAYICIRAFTVEPMLDELLSFYTYIQTGDIMNDRTWLDANNHLLNSYVGWLFYSNFGSHFIFFRLLAVLSFPIYFFSIKWLVEMLIKSKLNWIVFLAIVSTPWVIEYFGFSRGYGASLAFLFAGFCFMIQFKEVNNAKYFIFGLTLFGLSISANLSLLIPSLIFIAYALVYHIIQWRRIKNKWLSIIWIILFIKFLGIILNYIEKLKSVNAFWWGSRDGLWEVTGKSLSSTVFFNDSLVFKYILIICSALIILIWLTLQFRRPLKDIFVSNSFWIPGVLIAIICSFVFMANYMEINYPKDRVAMYLVPYFLLVIGMLFSTNTYLKWTLLLLLWFPISFVLKMNLTSSIFSPADRFSKQFSAQLKNKFQDDDVLSIDYCSHLNYSYIARNQKGKVHIAVESAHDPTIEQGEYHISWMNDYNWDDFNKIYEEPNTKTRLYKRKKPFNKRLILDTIIPLIQTNENNLTLKTLDLSDIVKGSFIQSQVESYVSLKEGTTSLNLSTHIESETEKPRFYQRTRFEWYFGHQKNYQFNFPNYPMKIEDSDTKFFIVLENGERRDVILKNTRIRFYQVYL